MRSEEDGRTGEMTLVWQGAASQWECDHMGHLNTRFYIKRLAEGLQALAVRLGLPPHAGDGDPVLRGVQVHARFLTEVHVAQPLCLRIGVLETGPDDLLLQAALVDPDGTTLFAGFVVRAALFDRAATKVMPLPTGLLSKADTLRVPPDARLQPRSFDQVPLSADFLDTGAAMPPVVGVGAFMADSVDPYGVMRMEEPIARLADSMGGLMRPYRGAVIDHAEPVPARPGGAMLETRIDILRFSPAGAAFQLSGVLTGYGSKTQSIESLLIDACDGGVIAVMRCVAIVFDLDRRCAVPVSVKAAEQLSALVRPSFLL